MGSCVGTSKNAIRDAHSKYDEVINDLNETQTQRDLELQFHCLIAKVKLKRCTHYQELTIRISFAEFEEFDLKPKFVIKESARWDIEHFVEFKATEHYLKHNFLSLYVFDMKKQVIGMLKINLYLLASGPYHQDFSIPLPQAEGARVTFNLKISQLVRFHISLQNAELTPKGRQFPGDTFAFCLRTIIGDKTEDSSLSSKYVVGFSKSHSYREDEAKIKRETTSFHSLHDLSNQQNIVPTRKNINWSSDISQLPSAHSYVPFYELQKANFNIVFYTFPNEGKQFYSESYISYNKIAEHQSEVVNEVANGLTISWIVRSFELELQTWDHGRQTGKGKFHLVFKLQSHIKQMKLCVRTEKGVLESSPSFNQLRGDSSLPEQLDELKSISNSIQNLFIKASKNNHQSLSKNQQQNWTTSMNTHLKNQEQILLSSSKESKFMFFYSDKKALLKGQKGLIEVGFRTKDMLHEIRESVRTSCWEVLIALLKRNQLNLIHMGYNVTQINECNQSDLSDYLKEKKTMSLSYYTLLIDLLQVALQSFEGYNCEMEKEFAENFCAYTYFRIPRFRNQILTAITRSTDPTIEQTGEEELNALEWIDSMSMKDIPLAGRNSLNLMFDWENNFIKVIEREQGFANIEKRITEMFRINGWEQRMRNRGGAFFSFIRYWVDYVQSISAPNFKHVNWRYFPGYNKILHSLLAELKLRNVEAYTESMCKAVASLVVNEKLLSPIIVILYNKTNSNNQISVAKAIDLISLLFKRISCQCQILPASFDIKYFLKGMKQILEGQSSYAISKTLLLVYDHFKLFPVEVRIEISLYLMSRVFFKLFLHWSSNVRSVFHNTILIRVYHEASTPLTEMIEREQDIHRAHPEYRTEIVLRYRKLLTILQNAQQFEHRIQKYKVDVFQKETFKKMRNKISQKRRSKEGKAQEHQTQQQQEKKLMHQLMQPRIESFSSSEELSKNLSILLDQAKQAKKKDEVIVRSKSKLNEHKVNHGRKRISYFDVQFENQLVPIKWRQIIYVKIALDEFRKINQSFIAHLEKQIDSVPVVSVSLSLDEKELRPDGQFKVQEW